MCKKFVDTLDFRFLGVIHSAKERMNSLALYRNQA